MSGSDTPRRGDIRAEIRRRAEHYLRQDRLIVDYNRIRRRLAFPLPVPRLILPTVPVPGMAEYPWATWLLWEIEERVNCLGWAAELFGDELARAVASSDLAGLAGWPHYHQYSPPDLSCGHAARIMWTALSLWRWPDESLRAGLQTACGRLADEVWPGSEKLYGAFGTAEEVLDSDLKLKLIHNIPLIGSLGAAMAADAAHHPRATDLARRAALLMRAVLDARAQGIVEGVGYDGYLLDFAVDFLRARPGNEGEDLLAHPRLSEYLEESFLLAVPGSPADVAELGDVEPLHMPFHLSAQAKLQALKPEPLRSWHLHRCPVGRLRADGLAALDAVPSEPATSTPAPAPGARDAHHAVVLRTGWERDDVAVAASFCRSPMGHMHNDNGSLVIGTRGRWFITDPGYQQYLPGEEREYTVGSRAHNAPVINGYAQATRAPRLLSMEMTREKVWEAAIDITGCFPPEARANLAVRRLWLVDRSAVVVADEVAGNGDMTLAYHWHGHRDAAWWARDGWMLIHLPEGDLWFTSPGAPLTHAHLHLLPGSRGSMTVVADARPANGLVWWVFAFAGPVAGIEVDPAARRLALPGLELQAGPEPGGSMTGGP
jgi:hypothetical protein